MLRRHFIINTESSIPNDEIWYTSSNGNIVTPYSAEELPTIVSNVYSGGKGVIKFKKDITSIGSSAFGFRSSLTSVTIPNSVTILHQGAFQDCSYLTYVRISKNVRRISFRAFSNCVNLRNILYENTIEQWGVVTKEDQWNVNVPATVVHCTDGDVEI